MNFSFSAYCRRCRLRRRFRQSLGCALAPRPPVFFSPGRGGGERSIPAPARRNTVLNYHCFWEVKINFIEKYKEIRNPTFFFFWRGGRWWGQKVSTAGCQCFFLAPTISSILNHEDFVSPSFLLLAWWGKDPEKSESPALLNGLWGPYNKWPKSNG